MPGLRFFPWVEDHQSFVLGEALQILPTRRGRQPFRSQHHPDHPRVARKANFQKFRDPDRICAGLCERLELLPANPHSGYSQKPGFPSPGGQ
jgi:hypothetical protein